jgi:preprotein translocase subunit SecG
MLYSIITVLIVIICVLLTLVVLLQPGQGQGLSGGLAGGAAMGGQGMGARRTADLLSKSTSVLGGAFLVLCVLANFAINKQDPNRSAVQESGVDVTAPADMNAPSNTQPAVPQTGGSDNGNNSGSQQQDNGSDN